MSIVCAHPTKLDGAIKLDLKFETQAMEETTSPRIRSARKIWVSPNTPVPEGRES